VPYLGGQFVNYNDICGQILYFELGHAFAINVWQFCAILQNPTHGETAENNMRVGKGIIHIEDDAGFRLSLADGEKWVLTGHPDLLPWLDQLASIMQLEKGCVDGCPRIHFCPMGGAPASTPESPWNGWDHQSLRLWFHDRKLEVLCEVNNSEGHETEIMNMWYALHPIYWGAIRSRGQPFHAALTERGGKGIILAAPGGTGKSTCCRRLPQSWKPLCDDEVLVLRDDSGGYRAHPFPTWSDYLWYRAKNTWNIEYHLPLQAVFFLSHAESDVCEPLGEARAAACINDSAAQVCRKYWQRKEGELRRAFTGRVFANACELAKAVPAFKLGISLNGRFWEEMERALDGL
jgi:SynChlorMet cassette protein ScmC